MRQQYMAEGTAWEFIEYFLMAETQREMLDSGFPTRKDVLQELLDSKIAGYDKKSRLQVTVNGKEEEIGGTGVFSGTEKPGTCGGHHQ